MADRSEKMSYHAGEAKGQAQEKVSGMVDKTCNATQYVKDSVHGAGEQVKDKAQGAVDVVKNATGINK